MNAPARAPESDESDSKPDLATPSRDVVVGLGSNLGDRLENLRTAAAAIARVYDVRARSTVYSTAPIGPPQPDYLNAAVRLRTAASAEEILRVLLSIEAAGGRVRTADNRWGARTIDLDVLWMNGVILSTPTLTIPHARLTERPFALLPLLDVAPDAKDPRTGERFVVPGDVTGVARTELTL